MNIFSTNLIVRSHSHCLWFRAVKRRNLVWRDLMNDTSDTCHFTCVNLWNQAFFCLCRQCLARKAIRWEGSSSTTFTPMLGHWVNDFFSIPASSQYPAMLCGHQGLRKCIWPSRPSFSKARIHRPLKSVEKLVDFIVSTPLTSLGFGVWLIWMAKQRWRPQPKFMLLF